MNADPHAPYSEEHAACGSRLIPPTNVREASGETALELAQRPFYGDPASDDDGPGSRSFGLDTHLHRPSAVHSGPRADSTCAYKGALQQPKTSA
jgi:hypothetical protein